MFFNIDFNLLNTFLKTNLATRRKKKKQKENFLRISE